MAIDRIVRRDKKNVLDSQRRVHETHQDDNVDSYGDYYLDEDEEERRFKLPEQPKSLLPERAEMHPLIRFDMMKFCKLKPYLDLPIENLFR